MPAYYVYIIECSDKGAKYTRGKKLKLVYYETCLSNSDARRREIEIKKLPLEQKRKIVAGVKDEN